MPQTEALQRRPPHPGRVKAGKDTAAARWGPARIIRLDELDADERRLVAALVDAVRAAARAKAGQS